MKSKTGFILSALFVLLAFSCKKDLEDILVKKGGKWNIETYHHKESIPGSVLIDTVVYDFGNITFSENGKSIFIIGNASFGIDTMTFDWSVENHNGQVVTIDPVAADTIIWKVEESSQKEQTWSNSRSDSLNSDLRLTEEKITIHSVK